MPVEEIRNAEQARLATRMPEQTIQVMLNAGWHSLSDGAHSNNDQDGEDKEHNKVY
jgi:hypothetical protein